MSCSPRFRTFLIALVGLFVMMSALSLGGCAHKPAKKPDEKPPSSSEAPAQAQPQAPAPQQGLDAEAAASLEKLKACALNCPEPDRSAAADLYVGWSRVIEIHKAQQADPSSRELWAQEATEAFDLITRGLLRYMRWAPDTPAKLNAARDVLEFSSSVRQGDPATAEKLLVEVDATVDDLIKTEPPSSDTLLLHGLVLEQQNADEGEIRDTYARCLDLEPGNQECRRLFVENGGQSLDKK